MDEREFRRVASTFRAFHRRFAPLFGRTEARRHGEQYVRGLLVAREERRTAENVAEAVKRWWGAKDATRGRCSSS